MTCIVAAGRLSTLMPREVRVVALPTAPDGIPREALVLRDEDGTPRAYLNRCRHLPIPLDGGSRRFLCREERYLQCGTHGARYRTSDGYCIAGPCSGERLQALALVERDDELSIELVL